MTSVGPVDSLPVRGGRVKALDGLRAVAVGLVIIGHGVSSDDPTRIERLVVQLGHLGVEIFFVLSGFLITTLLIGERAKSGAINLRRFYWRRTRRIFPAYWVFLIVVGLLALSQIIDVPLRIWLMDVFYLGDYASPTRAWWTSHTWSLAVEEQFYLFWPLILALCGLRVAKVVAMAIIAALPLVRLVTYLLVPSQRFDIVFMFHTRLDTLMVGSILAILVSERRLPTKWTKAPIRFTILPAAVVVIVAGMSVEALSRHLIYTFLIGYTLAAVSIAVLLVYLLARPKSFVAGILSLPPIVWLGRISYSLYLWQQLFASTKNHSLVRAFPFNVFASLVLATASYYLVERTFYRPKPYAGELLPNDPQNAESVSVPVAGFSVR